MYALAWLSAPPVLFLLPSHAMKPFNAGLAIGLQFSAFVRLAVAAVRDVYSARMMLIVPKRLRGREGLTK